MPSVYQVIPEMDSFQYFSPEETAALNDILFDGTEWRHTWEPQTVYVGNPKRPRPAIWGLMGKAAFVVPQTTAQAICRFLDESCELLPIICEESNEKFWLCNVTHVVNALDRKRSKHPEGVPHMYDEHFFHSK